MALTVEDGSVVAGAESYAAVADADTYHANRGNTDWAAAGTPAKEQALRKATDYMLQTYRPRWKGYRKSAAQALDWPRSFVYLEPYISGAVGPYPYLVSDSSVPAEVKNSCCELARRALTADLRADLDRQALREQVGPIAVEYDPASEYYKKYPAVDAALSPYLRGSGSNVEVERS